MQLFNYTEPSMIVADKGKHIRDINDVYIPEHTDEEGNLVPEHIPHYSTVLFVPPTYTEEMMNELYIEEEVK